MTEVTIHDLRRTVRSRMAIAYVNLPTIGRVLGHLSLNATQIYARLNIEAARRALEANAATLPLSLPTADGCEPALDGPEKWTALRIRRISMEARSAPHRSLMTWHHAASWRRARRTGASRS
ncbi:MAG: hypothetical protein JO189_03150 [Deltaproteobacteria bacterium]|nr:hypothetical protein [Deltaproteobacteria bacterium]